MTRMPEGFDHPVRWLYPLSISLNAGVVLMTLIKTTLSAVVIVGGVTAASLGLGASMASAQPAPPPAPVLGEVPPPNAPKKTAEFWNGEPVVWTSMWGGRWGVWKNGGFIPLTSNINTGGG